jgi:hypothetical protein
MRPLPLTLLALVTSCLAGAPPAEAHVPGPPALEEPNAGASELRGLTLEQALQRLRERGMQLVFSSALVRPEMLVASEPTTSDPKRLLEQLLAPHGLRAVAGDGDASIVVSRRPRAATGSTGGAVRGELRSTFDRTPVAGALVRVAGAGGDRANAGIDEPPAVLTTANGRFELGALEPGHYVVHVHHPGFAPHAATEIEVQQDGVAELRLELQPEPFLHDEIVVAAARSTLLHSEPAGPLSLSRRDVEALPHLGGDVFRALTLLPGTAANDNTAQLSVHGGRRDELLITLDGQELYQAFHLRDFDNGLSVVTADTLDGVTLSTGGYSAGHGDRMGGVLDLTTTSPRRRLNRLRLSVLNAQATSGGALGGDRGSWLASVRRGSIDLASRIFGREDPAFWDAHGKLEGSINDRHSLRLHALRAADTLDFGETAGAEVKRFDTDYDAGYAWLSHDAFLGARTLARTTLSRTTFDRDRRGFESEDEQTWAVLDRRATEVRSLDLRFAFEASPRASTEWGAAFRRFDTEYDYSSTAEAPLLPASPFFEPRAELRRFLGHARDEHTEAWVSQRFTPASSVTVELGGRFDRHTLTDDELWSPRLSLAWRAGRESVVRAGWGRYHQSQRSYELGVADGESAFARAERAEHAVVGYERQLSKDPRAAFRALRLEAYRRSIDDPRGRFENLYEPINTFPEIEPDRVLVRAERARAQGVELTLRGAFGEQASWWLSYALSRAEDRIAGEWIPRPLDQTHALTLFFGRRLGEAWQLDLAWRYHTGWPTTPIRAVPGVPAPGDPEEGEGEDDDGAGEDEGTGEGRELEPVFLVGRLGSDRLSDYHRLDLRLSRTWTFSSQTLRFFIDVQNAYDRQNIGGFDLDFDEDTGTLSKVSERWNGIFPSVGVVWEF